MIDLLESLKTRMGQGKTSGTSDGVSHRKRSPTTLYSCPDCETTFISEEMESCPKCDGGLDRTPDEYELGIGPGSPASGHDPRHQ